MRLWPPPQLTIPPLRFTLQRLYEWNESVGCFYIHAHILTLMWVSYRTWHCFMIGEWIFPQNLWSIIKFHINNATAFFVYAHVQSPQPYGYSILSFGLSINIRPFLLETISTNYKPISNAIKCYEQTSFFPLEHTEPKIEFMTNIFNISHLRDSNQKAQGPL